MLLAQHGVNGSASGEKNRNLNFDGSVTTLDKNAWIIGDRTPCEVNMGNSLVYHQGRTIIAAGSPWTSGYGALGKLIVYDRDNGLYPAGIEISSKSGESDRHILPVFGIADDGSMLVIQENRHVENINVFHGSADFSRFYKQPTITSLASRLTVFKISTGWAILYQYNQDELYVSKCDPDGTNWNTPQIVIDGTSSSRTYMLKPHGTDKDSEGRYCFVVIPIYTDGASVHTKFVVYTTDFVTFENRQRTHSFNAGSPMTDVTLHANGYTAIGVYNVTAEYAIGCAGVTREGLIYIFSWDLAAGGNIKTTTFRDGAWVTVNAATGFDVDSPNAVDGTNPMWCAVCSRSEIYLMLSIGQKPHLIRSSNGGVSWTDLGDMLPGKSGYYRGSGPNNIHDIPDNENFVFVFNENLFDNVTPFPADIYLVRASFGDRNIENPVTFTDTVTNISDIAGADFIYSVDDFDSTVTGFNDLTGGGRTGTKVGSPAISSGEVLFNGTNQMIRVTNSTDFANDDKFTFACVARLVGGAQGYLLACAVSTSSTAFCHITLTTTGLSVFRRSPSGAGETLQVNSAAFNTAVHNVIVVQSDGAHYRIFVNGVELQKTYTIGAGIGDLIHNGKWAASVAGMNRVSLAGLDRSGTVYSNVAFKDAIYYPSVISRYNRKRIERKLATDRSITITSYVED